MGEACGAVAHHVCALWCWAVLTSAGRMDTAKRGGLPEGTTLAHYSVRRKAMKTCAKMGRGQMCKSLRETRWVRKLTSFIGLPSVGGGVKLYSNRSWSNKRYIFTSPLPFRILGSTWLITTLQMIKACQWAVPSRVPQTAPYERSGESVDATQRHSARMGEIIASLRQYIRHDYPRNSGNGW